MNALTRRQKEVLDFIRNYQHQHQVSPSLREIASHFGFRSMTAAVDHVRALRKKGILLPDSHRARALRVSSPWGKVRHRVMDIPIYGSIPAGFAENQQQEVKGCISVDIGSIGFKPTQRTFALEVKGDSMIGRHILPGDLVILEHGIPARNGDIVAALIDNESTLKTLVQERGKIYLRAENPKYPQITPVNELVIQGVMVALIRRRK